MWLTASPEQELVPDAVTGIPWLSALILVPVVIGAALMLAGNRFWAWPYVYLHALYLALFRTPSVSVDAAYYLFSEGLLLVFIIAAEIFGLITGRAFNRMAGVIYFTVTSALAFGTALGLHGLQLTIPWHYSTLIACGLLFFIQALIQLALSNEQSREQPVKGLAMELADEDDEDLIPEPEPLVNPGSGPWTIRIDGVPESLEKQDDGPAG